jgi:HEAT repeat protein
MLAVALGNMVDVRAADLLLKLLHDEEVVGHALIALGKLKVQKARPQIESLLKHRKPWVRKEAQKALASLDN